MTEEDINASVAKAVERSRQSTGKRDWKWYDAQDTTYSHLGNLSAGELLGVSREKVDMALHCVNGALQAFLRGCDRSVESEWIARVLSEVRLPLAQVSVRMGDAGRIGSVA